MVLSGNIFRRLSAGARLFRFVKFRTLYVDARERFPELYAYRYTDDELREWVPKVNELADSGREVHLLMNNCYRDQAVDNAAQLAKLLTG